MLPLIFLKLLTSIEEDGKIEKFGLLHVFLVKFWGAAERNDNLLRRPSWNPNQKINNVDQTTKQVEKNKNYKTENIEKTINRVLKKIEKKELKLSELTTSLEKHEFKNTRNSDEYNTLIQNIKETQEDLFFLEK